MSLLEANTASEQQLFDNKRLALQKRFLETELSQKQELNKIEQQKQDLANRATALAKSRLSIDNRQISVEQDKLGVLQEQNKTLQEQLKTKAQLAKSDVNKADDKISSLEAELDRLVAEGKAPLEAKKRREAELEEKQDLNKSFIVNRLSGSAEEQNIQQQLIAAEKAKKQAEREQRAIEKQQANAAKEEARLKKEQEVKEQEKKANNVEAEGIDIASRLKELTGDAEELNTREQTLKEKGLLTPEEQENIDAERNLIKQEVGQLTEKRDLDREEAGVGKQGIDNVIDEQADAVKETLNDSSKVAAEVADQMNIANATITIGNANIQGLSDMMQNSVDNGKSAISDTAQSSSEASTAASPVVDETASAPAPETNTVNSQSTENVNITNNWGTLLDQRALARTKGV